MRKLNERANPEFARFFSLRGATSLEYWGPGATRQHLRERSIAVKVGDAVKSGSLIAQLGNTGPSQGPHLHFGLLDKPDPVAGRSLPFVFGSFTLAGTVDLDASEGGRLVIRPESRPVRFACPLYGGIQDFP